MAQSNTTKIGVATATIIGMNAMIGSGIFTAPTAMAAFVGPAGIIAYALVVVSVWFMAVSLARLAALFPEEGSFYTYAKQWGGHTIGLIAGSIYLFGLLIAMGLLAQMAGLYLHTFFPTISQKTLGLLALGALVGLNLFGVILSELGQQILIVTTVFPLLVITILCLTKVNFSHLTPFAPYGLGNVLKATRIVIFGFFGFECAASLFTIVKNPERNVPRALTYSILIVGMLYMLFVASLILSTPFEYFLTPNTPLPEILRITFPNQQWMLTTVHIAILSAILGTIHSMIWSSSVLLISLTKKIQKYRFSHLINQQTAVLLVGACIFLSYILIKNDMLFFAITATSIVSAFILSMITLLTMKSEWRSGQNIKTLFGIITASAILYFACEGLVQELTKLM
ncbi:MAG: amino acid permease [bacterium]|nr:amino acid permease [bacterium]